MIADSLAFIGRNYSGQLTLESVAESVQMSKYHFSRLFHCAVGMTFQDYLARVRVLKAEEMLRQMPTRSVTRVAIEVGFGTLRNMEKHFRSHVGLTPSQYRSRLVRRRRKSFTG